MEKSSNSPQISDEAIDNFATLFEILKQIHIRLINEGYAIDENGISLPDTKDEVA